MLCEAFLFLCPPPPPPPPRNCSVRVPRSAEDNSSQTTDMPSESGDVPTNPENGEANLTTPDGDVPTVLWIFTSVGTLTLDGSSMSFQEDGTNGLSKVFAAAGFGFRATGGNRSACTYMGFRD